MLPSFELNVKEFTADIYNLKESWGKSTNMSDMSQRVKKRALVCSMGDPSMLLSLMFDMYMLNMSVCGLKAKSLFFWFVYLCGY